jgi:hypothetical protein
VRPGFRRDRTLPAEVLGRADLPRGTKVLSATRAGDGTWLLGTRDALVLVPDDDGAVRAVAWEQVASADWSRDDETLRVVEVGEFGQPRPTYSFAIDEPGRFLQLVRERVTASVVMQRRVTVRGREGFSVIGRRAPRGGGAITWAYELDPGLDPEDPEVQRLAAGALRAAADELGLG